MKWINNSKGLTLIEIILSMAILGIVFVLFLNIFTYGFINIVRSEHRADAAYLSQQEMTKQLIREETFIEETDIIYDFSGGPSITINVRIMEAETTINGNTSRMKSFILKP